MLASTVIVHVNERQRGRLDIFFNKRGGENLWRSVATLNVDSRTSSVHMWADFNAVAQAGDKGVLQVVFSPFVTNITDWEEYYDQVFSDDDDEDDDDVNNVDVALAVAASRGGNMDSFQGYSLVPLYQCADIELIPGTEDRYYEQEDDDESGSPEFNYSTWRTVLVAMGAVAALACVLGS
ncbi:hypothetical protein H4R35_001953 [Dimargaris xerosporica]|nr:hypothetical protein H4R35_001953 [Dimargaris xerosporica]